MLISALSHPANQKSAFYAGSLMHIDGTIMEGGVGGRMDVCAGQKAT